MNNNMIDYKEIINNYKKNKFMKSIILIICVAIFSNLTFIYFNNFHNQNRLINITFKALFAWLTIMWSLSIIVFIITLIQFILYKILINKLNNNLLISNILVNFCIIFQIIKVKDKTVKIKDKQRFILLLKPLVASIVIHVIFLIIVGYKVYEIFSKNELVQNWQQILYLVVFITLIVNFVRTILHIPYSFWLYSYQGNGSTKIKILAILVGSYFTYKKIIKLNKKLTLVKD